jgi:hypothetical protein
MHATAASTRTILTLKLRFIQILLGACSHPGVVSCICNSRDLCLHMRFLSAADFPFIAFREAANYCFLGAGSEGSET